MLNSRRQAIIYLINGVLWQIPYSMMSRQCLWTPKRMGSQKQKRPEGVLIFIFLWHPFHRICQRTING